MPNHFLATQLRPALVGFLALSVLTGLAYPLAVLGLARTIFPAQAEGSLIRQNGQVVGSGLIGQYCTDPALFWSRPSATVDVEGKPRPYNAMASGGSNLGPSNPELGRSAQARIEALRARDPEARGPYPVDLVTASGSGLDPHISPASALFQVRRVARARGLSEEQVLDLVLKHTEPPQLGILGEARVNVLKLNLALAELR